MGLSIFVVSYVGWPIAMHKRVRCRIQWLAVCVASMAIACQSSEPEPPSRQEAGPEATKSDQVPAEKPKHNFILITADTMRGDVASIDGGPAYTPTMAKMREHGWHFRRCISTSMLTNPSHASIMTSLYSQDHGVYDNSSGIAESHVTLAEAYADAGYDTHAVIAFKHLDPHVSRLGQGFKSVSPAPSREPDALASVERALEWLRARPTRETPFFMWLHIVDPHAPYEATALDENREPLTAIKPMSKARRAAPGFQKSHPWYQSVFERNKTTELTQARYVTEVELVDRGLEMLLDGLKALKLDATTGIVFTSDHGENLGEQDLFFHHGGLYDSTVHVPLLFHLPWEPGAQEYESLVSTIDIAPSMLALSGLEVPDSMRGMELGSLLRGAKPTRAHAYSEHLYGLLTAVRSQTHTLIVHNKNSKMFPSYRFKKGREEWLGAKNVSASTKASLRKALSSWKRGQLGAASVKPESQDMESLRQLGYVD